MTGSFLNIEVFEVKQKSDFFSNKWLINKMITSSVSESAKIEHINLRKLQKLHTPISNTSLPNKNSQNIRRQNFKIYDISCMDLPSLIFKAFEILAGIHVKIIHTSKYFIVCISEVQHRLWVICFMF